ncbi:arginase family protein [Amnibacterium setariae]|uniref:Arginase family protein n=1 Tax=Amnibacterium setariae TaxID=2306585 RepID=A0A3A1TYZ1_9MICO|nr:arginase family protein [Amnibacterium setariae]RIX28980.1 arginase family protein [Amnibacterium setariae]
MSLQRSSVVNRFAGRAGDRNDRAMLGSLRLADAAADRLEVPLRTIGSPSPALSAGWEVELHAALPELRQMQEVVQEQLAAGLHPFTASSRCAVALATLPAVAAARPDALVVWFDAHPDLNTPLTTSTGYLGGLALAGPLGLWDSGLGAGLTAERVVLAGARDVDPAEDETIRRTGVPVVPVDDAFADRLTDAVGGRPVYVHIDCDVLEPGIVPTEYAVPGGPRLEQLHRAAAVLARNEVVGVELGELEDAADRPADVDALLDALAPLLRR